METGSLGSDKQPTPLSVEVELPRGGAIFGMPIPLQFTIRNRSSRVIWVDESWLPWTFRGSLKLSVERSSLVLLKAVADLGPSECTMLAPGEQLVGGINLGDRLYVPVQSPTAKRVRLSVGVNLHVGEGDRRELMWTVRKFDVGEITVDVPANAMGDRWPSVVFPRPEPSSLPEAAKGDPT